MSNLKRPRGAVHAGVCHCNGSHPRGVHHLHLLVVYIPIRDCWNLLRCLCSYIVEKAPATLVKNTLLSHSITAHKRHAPLSAVSSLKNSKTLILKTYEKKGLHGTKLQHPLLGHSCAVCRRRCASLPQLYRSELESFNRIYYRRSNAHLCLYRMEMPQVKNTPRAKLSGIFLCHLFFTVRLHLKITPRDFQRILKVGRNRDIMPSEVIL